MVDAGIEGVDLARQRGPVGFRLDRQMIDDGTLGFLPFFSDARSFPKTGFHFSDQALSFGSFG
jgi:hypothetical protein